VQDTAGKELGGLAAVFKHATGKDAASDEAAKARFDEVYSVYLKSDDAYVTAIEVDEATPINLYVRKPGGAYFVFGSLHGAVGESITASPSSTGGDRFLVVTINEEFHERVTACLDGEIDEDDCGTATGDAGEALAHYIVDRDAMRIVASVYDGRGEEGSCQDAKAPTVSGDTWTWTACDKTTQTFTLRALAPCTKELFEKRATERFEAEMKKAEAERAKTAAERRPAEEVTTLVNEGRKLTAAKKYDDAIALFDKVLETNPDTLRALSGRAYAKLMRSKDDDLQKAEADFEAAYNMAPKGSDADDKVRAQILYNRGLISEKTQDGRAKAFFEKAHELSPSAATKKKLGLTE